MTRGCERPDWASLFSSRVTNKSSSKMSKGSSVFKWHHLVLVWKRAWLTLLTFLTVFQRRGEQTRKYWQVKWFLPKRCTSARMQVRSWGSPFFKLLSAAEAKRHLLCWGKEKNSHWSKITRHNNKWYQFLMTATYLANVEFWLLRWNIPLHNLNGQQEGFLAISWF